jgi:hypothetical protein
VTRPAHPSGPRRFPGREGLVRVENAAEALDQSRVAASAGAVRPSSPVKVIARRGRSWRCSRRRSHPCRPTRRGTRARARSRSPGAAASPVRPSRRALRSSAMARRVVLPGQADRRGRRLRLRPARRALRHVGGRDTIASSLLEKRRDDLADRQALPVRLHRLRGELQRRRPDDGPPGRGHESSSPASTRPGAASGTGRSRCRARSSAGRRTPRAGRSRRPVQDHAAQVARDERRLRG